MVDAIFVGDIVISFFMPYRASARKGGMMVYDNRKICVTYLRGWFLLDVFTVKHRHRPLSHMLAIPPQIAHPTPKRGGIEAERAETGTPHT